MISEFPKRDLERSSAEKFVLLSGRDVDDAGRLMRLLSEPSEDAALATSADRPRMISRALLIEAACKERMRRRRRAKVLPKDMFGEPAWDILLQLYAEQQAGRLKIARLTSDLELPATTVLRWLSYLEDRQLVRREDHPTDHRSVIIELTAEAIQAIDTYFFEVLGFPA